MKNSRYTPVILHIAGIRGVTAGTGNRRSAGLCKHGFKFVYRTAALLLAAALLTAGCGGSGRADTEDSAEAYQWLDDYEPVSREPLTLTRWETDSLEDLERAGEIFEQHTGVEVRLQILTWDDYIKMLDRDFAEGEDPGLFRLHPYFAQKYIRQGSIRNLSDMPFEDLPELTALQTDTIMSIYRMGDDIYGIPLIGGVCSALWYNKSIFDDCHLQYPDAGWSWEDVADAAAIIQKSGKGYDGIRLSDTNGEEGYYNIIASYGGYVSNDIATESGMANQETLQAMDLTADMIREGMPSYEEMQTSAIYEDFIAGKTGMAILGSWRVPSLLDNAYALENMDCTVLPFAETTGIRGAAINCSCWSMWSGTGRAEDYWNLLRTMTVYTIMEKGDTDEILPVSAREKKKYADGGFPFHLEAYSDLLRGSPAVDPVNRVQIPWSLDTDTWNRIQIRSMRKAWKDPDHMRQYCTEAAAEINEALEQEGVQYSMAYIRRDSATAACCIIDTDARKIRYFADGGKIRFTGVYTGDFENGAAVSYGSSGIEEYIRFRDPGDPGFLLVRDAFGRTWTFEKADLREAFELIRSSS